jgi:hypothetical protein
MSIVRQMSQLLLRGSLANVTMANLTEEQQSHIDQVMLKVSSHPKMANHKARFIKELGSTIGADYREDRSTAEEEFQIAIWRGAVDLVYHNKYQFSCKSCSNTSYIGKNGRRKEFDRQYPICPSCNKVEISSTGDTQYFIGQFVDHHLFQSSYHDFNKDQQPPKCKSPILYHVVSSRYDNPTDILNDDEQMVKFFSEYLWNYFRQMLKENGRFEHHKSPKLISGPGHEILLEEILSLCKKMKIEHHYCKETQPKNEYIIGIYGLKTPPEFTCELLEILQKANNNNIHIRVNIDSIIIKRNDNAPILEAFVSKPEHVIMLSGHQSPNENEEGQNFTISQISYRTIGVEQMQQVNHTAIIDNEDVITAIRHSLPDGECQQVFDIWSGRGETFIEFSKEYGDKRACINHIARYMGITTRAVNQYKETIRINMLAHGMCPE